MIRFQGLILNIKLKIEMLLVSTRVTDIRLKWNVVLGLNNSMYFSLLNLFH